MRLVFIRAKMHQILFIVWVKELSYFKIVYFWVFLSFFSVNVKKYVDLSSQVTYVCMEVSMQNIQVEPILFGWTFSMT